MSALPEVVATWRDAGPGRAVVRCRDLVELRRTRPDGRARAIGVWLDEAPAALTLVPPSGWPALLGLRSRVRPDGVWTVLRFAEPVDVAAVVAELGRQAVWNGAVVPAEVRVDARVLNPTGFLVRVDGPPVDGRDLAVDDGVSATLVAGLREHLGVRIDVWTDALRRAVPALAAAGVPLVATDAPGDLDPAVAAAVTAPVDLADPLAREEHSIVLRRAALDAYAPTPQPSVSILLATRRADMLDHALGQVARQRGVDRLELVLAPHGFDVPVETVQEARRTGRGGAGAAPPA